ncbi:MAG TPA: hypothetical protein DEA08_19970 [Planctomycetes bacterium]|nr:hypothetical protein [Planctomycetota bacterium]
MQVLAFETLDCASKLRIHYLLPLELELGLCEALAARDERLLLDVQAFSKLVAGAKDHVTVRRPHDLRVAGVLGEPRLVATYAKGERMDPQGAQALVEGFLAERFTRLERVTTERRREVLLGEEDD